MTTVGTASGSTTYNYTTKGNRTTVVTPSGTQTYTPGADNRPQSDGIWNYTFDTEGNVTQKTGVTNPNDIWVYGYDFRNLMTSATHTLNGTTTVQETDKYDVFGHRVELQVSINGGAPTTQKFAYDGQDISADLDASKALTMRRLYVDGQVAARIDTSSTVAFYLPDHLGSIRDLMNSSGQLIDHIDYDAFGNITNETQQSNGDRYKYAGYQWDASVSLYSVQARWYDPATGRWTSEDPLAFAAGDDNLNRYVGNAPTNGTDPSGLDATPAYVIRAAQDAKAMAAAFYDRGQEPHEKLRRVFDIYGEGLTRRQYTYHLFEHLVDEYEAQAHAEGMRTSQTYRNEDAERREGARREAATNQFYAEYLSSYKKKLDDEFWNGIAYFNFLTQTVLTTATPVQAGLISATLYAGTGNYKEAGESLAGAGLAYGGGKLLQWGGGKVLGWLSRGRGTAAKTVETGSRTLGALKANEAEQIAAAERLAAREAGRYAMGTGKWGKGSFGSAEEALLYHFERHGAEVGAKDAAQYLRKAEGFAQNLRGARKSPAPGATPRVSRYKKLGKYIDIDPEGNIISFGSQ